MDDTGKEYQYGIQHRAFGDVNDALEKLRGHNISFVSFEFREANWLVSKGKTGYVIISDKTPAKTTNGFRISSIKDYLLNSK